MPIFLRVERNFEAISPSMLSRQLLRCLRRELKWLKSVDPTKADKAAMRALSHAKLT